MVINATVLKNIRWASVVSMVAVVAAGFIFPVSLVHGLIVSPVLLILLMSLYAYADFKLDSKETSGEIHLFPHCRKRIIHSEKRAA